MFAEDVADATPDLPSADRIIAHAIARELRELATEATRIAAICDSGALPENYEGVLLEAKAMQCKRLIRAEAMARALALMARTPEEVAPAADEGAQVVMTESHQRRADQLEKGAA